MAKISRFRTRELKVKLSEDEYAIIIQNSHEAEMNISDAVRSLIVYGSINAKWLDKESKEIMNNANKNIRALVDSISKVGANLNQIAYCTNVIGDENDIIVEEALLHAREITGMLIETYRDLKDLCDKNSLSFNHNNQPINIIFKNSKYFGTSIEVTFFYFDNTIKKCNISQEIKKNY